MLTIKLFFLVVPVILFAPLASIAAVTINEVVYDPAGSDTGAEWLELHNNSSEAVDLSGWQLYPDGVGYYTFLSGVLLPGKGFLTVHLRTSGEDTKTDVYHPNATGNMGNSSGSAALFSSSARSKETMQAFFRYHKAGSSERKTWESTAVEAGFWQKDTSVDIANAVEGNSLGLIQDGVTSSFASAWKLFTTPTEGLLNSAGSQETGGVATSSQSSWATVPLYRVPRLETLIISQSTAIIGAPHRFEARAFGENGAAISGETRFLWNFGDGSVAEGKNVHHTFSFPGDYRISLDAATGEALGSAIFDIRAGQNGVMISEVLPGEGGFIELFNGGDAAVDIGGWMIEDREGHHFTIPAKTNIRALGVMVLPNKTTDLLLATSTELVLQYANLKEIGRVSLQRVSGEHSVTWDGDEWVPGEPTPGKVSGPAVSAVSPIRTDTDRAEVVKDEDSGSVESLAAVVQAAERDEPSPGGEGEAKEQTGALGLFLLAASLLGGVGALIFVFLRRAMALG